MSARTGVAQQQPAPPPAPPPQAPVPAAPPVSAPLPPTAAAVALAAYRLPVIAMVQPLAGGVLLQDRPVVVFRFAAGEPNDPLDLGSFRVVVDGQDRTALFQVSGTEAWGPLTAAATTTAPTLALGVHQVAARICSSRGACGEVSAAPMVTGGTTVSRAEAGAAPAESRKSRVFDLVLQAARRIMAP